jgi:biotin carboxyl carrier protein
VRIISLPRGAICVFTDDGARIVATRDSAGRLWVDYSGGHSYGHQHARSVIASDRASAPGPGAVDIVFDGVVRSPTAGRVTAILVHPGAQVAAGTAIAVIELMKTQVRVTTPRAGRVSELHVSVNAAIEPGDPVATIASEPST